MTEFCVIRAQYNRSKSSEEESPRARKPVKKTKPVIRWSRCRQPDASDGWGFGQGAIFSGRINATIHAEEQAQQEVSRTKKHAPFPTPIITS